jgi:hypothetical protein
MMELTAAGGNLPGGLQGNAPANISRPIAESSVDSYGSSVSFSTAYVNPQYSFYNDVFLGAGSPKQPESPADFLPVVTRSIDNSGRTPPSAVFDTQPSFSSFNSASLT